MRAGPMYARLVPPNKEEAASPCSRGIAGSWRAVAAAHSPAAVVLLSDWRGVPYLSAAVICNVIKLMTGLGTFLGLSPSAGITIAAGEEELAAF